ncbi:MAG TPA: glycosyltransferase family 4 protein [Pirellulales bacterium]
MPRLMYLATAPEALRNLADGQLAYFRARGYEVIAVANPGEDLDFVAQREQIQTVAVSMRREIQPIADLVSLWRLWRLMRCQRPDIVVAGTAKAGLVGMLAAWLARVSVRIYLLRGLRLETTHGLKRRILLVAEKIAAGCAQRMICVSNSLRDQAIARGIVSPEKAIVLLHGSSNGILADQFAQTPEVRATAKQLRGGWGIPANAPVIGFVGRFVRDKGFVELADAFDQIIAEQPDARLLLVGHYENGDPVPESYVRRIAEHPQIIRPGFIRDLAPYYGTMDVLAFPTHREGFPNVILQASAAGLPVVAFRATGALDAVEDGVTGALVDVGDVQGLAAALLHYIDDAALRRQHGRAARDRVLRDFQREPIWAALDAEFRQLLEASS